MSTKKRVSLVIGSGGIKCAAAAGLWRVLKSENIEVDSIVGCSGGSIYAGLIANYPIISIEDGLDENDWDGWKIMTDKLGKKIGSVETTVQCLVELRNRDGKISMKTYNDAIAYLLSNGIDIKLNALQRRVSRACKVGSDGQSPIEEVDVLLTGEGSEVSSLTNPSYTNRRTEELSSKTGRPKGTTMEYKKEIP